MRYFAGLVPILGRRSWPDLLSLLRLWAIPLLWVLAAWRLDRALAIGVSLAAATDVIDGRIARRLHQETAAGSRLDSLADHLLTTSVLAWLIWLRPGFVSDQRALLLSWASIGGTALMVGWIRFRRIGDLHLYSAKVAGTSGYLFAISLLFFDSYHPAVFYLVIAACLIASTESLLAVVFLPSVHERIGSLLLRRNWIRSS